MKNYETETGSPQKSWFLFFGIPLSDVTGQFIMEGEHLAMKVFVSYTWEDNEHMDWVENLATRLRRDGIDITLDR